MDESTSEAAARWSKRRTTISWLLILLAVVLYSLPLWPRGGHSVARPGFVIAAAAAADEQNPVFQEESLNAHSAPPVSHVASICELPSGGLAAAWYSGSTEGARDVAIYFATRSPGEAAWSQPRAILTRESAARDLNRHIKKLGNSVLFSDDLGHLWLLFGTISVGGWSGSSLNLMRSDDEGCSWLPARRLTANPFFNLGELVRNRPVALSDGSWVVPIYQELVGRLAELLWLPQSADDFAEATKSRINGGRSGFQPTLVPLSTKTALAILRDFSPRQRISVARTEDAGQSWSAPEVLSLPNADSGLTALRLSDGRVILVFNDSTTTRNNLRLALSADEGRTWTRLATLAEDNVVGVGYPFAIQTRDGRIHIVYTSGRTTIKHLVFNPAWLSARQTMASK